MRSLPLVSLGFLLCAACNRGTPAAAATAPTGTPVAANEPKPPPRTLPAQPAAPAEAAQVIQGTVEETMDAASYTYLRIKTAGGDAWAAVPQTPVKIGATVAITGAMLMEGFESPTLKRKFDRIWFGNLGGGAPGAAAPALSPDAKMPQDAAHAGVGAPPTSGSAFAAGMKAGTPAAAPAPMDVKVPKATGPGAHTVAEVWAQKAKLKDAKVSVRGKVVKSTGGVLGKNWLHLQDGTGAAGADNDITVTTAATAAVGDVVTVQGTVHLDRDFGAGYAYPVIIEDATVAK